MRHKRLRGWIYKCSLRNPDPAQRASWVDPDHGSWLHQDDGCEANNWGGERWIRSPLSWGYLSQAERGDLVFCHQTDLNGLVGITIAASAGYPDPDGDREDTCSTIDLGPERVTFEQAVTVRMIRAMAGKVEMEAYSNATQLHTFHPVEDKLLLPLLELCCCVNPRQKNAILELSGMNYKRPTRRPRSPR